MRVFLLLNLEMLVRKLFPHIPNNRFIVIGYLEPNRLIAVQIVIERISLIALFALYKQCAVIAKPIAIVYRPNLDFIIIVIFRLDNDIIFCIFRNLKPLVARVEQIIFRFDFFLFRFFCFRYLLLCLLLCLLLNGRLLILLLLSLLLLHLHKLLNQKRIHDSRLCVICV